MEGPRIAEEVGSDKVESRCDDGSVIIRLRVAGLPALRSWILGLLDHAEILEPPEFRAELVAWLTGMASGASESPTGRRVPDLPPGRPATGDGGAARPVPGRETSQRLRRLLAVVGWLAQVGEAPIADVARRFSMDEDELIRELELAACCGVPPYTPDTLMEIEVSETSVRAFLPPEFARPRRLTPAEGFAVAASARLIMAVPGPDDGALRRALSKLDAALGSREAIGVDVDAPSSLAAVRRACEAGQAVEIDYHSASRDESTTRVVEPVAGDHDGRPLVPRRLLPPGGGHAALPSRSHRRRAAARRAGPRRRRARRGRQRTPFFPAPAPSKSSSIWAKAPNGYPSPCPCAPWRTRRPGR